MSERFRFWTVVKFGSLDKKHLNKMRHELIFNGICMKPMAEWRSKRKIVAFLAATQKYKNFVNHILSVREKILKMQERGRKLFAMNQVRMNILRKMWKDQRAEMLKVTPCPPPSTSRHRPEFLHCVAWPGPGQDEKYAQATPGWATLRPQAKTGPNLARSDTNSFFRSIRLQS